MELDSYEHSPGESNSTTEMSSHNLRSTQHNAPHGMDNLAEVGFSCLLVDNQQLQEISLHQFSTLFDVVVVTHAGCTMSHTSAPRLCNFQTKAIQKESTTPQPNKNLWLTHLAKIRASYTSILR